MLTSYSPYMLESERTMAENVQQTCCLLSWFVSVITYDGGVLGIIVCWTTGVLGCHCWTPSAVISGVVTREPIITFFDYVIQSGLSLLVTETVVLFWLAAGSHEVQIGSISGSQPGGRTGHAIICNQCFFSLWKTGSFYLGETVQVKLSEMEIICFGLSGANSSVQPVTRGSQSEIFCHSPLCLKFKPDYFAVSIYWNHSFSLQCKTRPEIAAELRLTNFPSINFLLSPIWELLTHVMDEIWCFTALLTHLTTLYHPIICTFKWS